ncbi:uncharacterized protein METZ01_LOCUS356648, partial [marine metagenome]
SNARTSRIVQKCGAGVFRKRNNRPPRRTSRWL